MYTLSSKLKLTAIILIVVGAIGLVYGFISTPSNEEELKELLAADAHGEHDSNQVDATVEVEGHGSASDAHHEESSEAHGEKAHGEGEHGDSHMEHVLHQFQTKPWSALFVSAFFFGSGKDSGVGAESRFLSDCCLVPLPFVSIRAITSPTSFISFGSASISTTVPAAEEGISESTLSVPISSRISSRATGSPTFLRHSSIVPSVRDSPIFGITTSMII